MDLAELYKGCRTYRRFSQKPVSHELLRRMLEVARTASSAANAQPLRYTVVEDPRAVTAMQPLVRWAAALPRELGTPVEGEQPTAFVVISKAEGANAFSDIDVGIAANMLASLAWEQGVGSCMMGAIDVGGIAELLGVPSGQTPRLVLALGYPAHASTVVEVPGTGELKYYLDERRDYFVPKRPFDEVVRFV